MATLSTLTKTVLRRTAKVALAIGLPLGVFYLLLALIGLAPTPYTCLTETRAKLRNLSGYDFDVSETSCDLIAHTDDVSVFVSETGKRKKALLFQYDPARLEDAFPVITVPDPQTIHIAVPWVSSIFTRQEMWNGVSIVYKIDRIDYPNEKQKDER